MTTYPLFWDWYPNNEQAMVSWRPEQKKRKIYKHAQQALKKIDASYNPIMTKAHKPITGGKYKVTDDKRIILIIEHEEDDIKWA